MPEKMSALERKHWNLAVAGNNTFRRFLLKYGDKTIQQISNPDASASSKNLFRGPEQDKYVLDPKDHNLVAIDMGHFFAAAQVPLGLGNHLGVLVEIDQLRRGYESAFQGEDFKANALGTIFGQHYLNNPKEGKSLGEKLRNFFRDYENDSVLFQTQERLYGINFKDHHTASNQKVDDSAMSNTINQPFSSTSNKDINNEITSNEAEKINSIALIKEKEALLKELEALNSPQTNFPDDRERSTQRTL
jgi:hypothetical protein